MENYASSKSLIQLQTDLLKLSSSLKETYELLKDNESELSDHWMDEKFEEFEKDFKSSRDHIIELSDKYEGWAKQYLPPIIEVVIEYEKATGKR